MVLHNNKWDRRAKGKYLKKHGLVTRDGELVKKDEAAKRDAQAASSSEDEAGEPDLRQGVAIENAFPEEAEEDDELARIRQLQQQQRAATGPAGGPVPEHKAHIQHGSKEMFERAQAQTARSQLNQQVGRFSKRHAAVEVDSDSDFEEFMDGLSD